MTTCVDDCRFQVAEVMLLFLPDGAFAQEPDTVTGFGELMTRREVNSSAAPSR